MTKLLVSACLLGEKLRYDGNDNLHTHSRLQAMSAAGDVAALCPEDEDHTDLAIDAAEAYSA